MNALVKFIGNDVFTDSMNDKVMNDINKLPAYKMCSYTQNLLKEKMKLNVSSYMINRLLTYKNNKE